MPSFWPTLARVPRELPDAARSSKTIATARSRSSAGCCFRDAMSPNFPRGHSLQETRGGPLNCAGCVASLDALHRAAAEFAVIGLDLVIAPRALAAARQPLDSPGLLLLGEIHGVRENPLLIRALMKAFGLTSLALECPGELTPMIRALLASRTLADHLWLRGGDGRITAGHLAVLADRAAAGPLELILSDGVIGADWSWSQRDEAMARRIPGHLPAECTHAGGSGQCPHPGPPHRAGRPDGRTRRRAAARDPGSPDQLWRREFLSLRAAPIRPPHRTAGKDTAPPAPRRVRPGPSRSHGGGRATAPAPMTRRPDPGHLITR
jgi:hypothetical protein